MVKTLHSPTFPICAWQKWFYFFYSGSGLPCQRLWSALHVGVFTPSRFHVDATFFKSRKIKERQRCRADGAWAIQGGCLLQWRATFQVGLVKRSRQRLLDMCRLLLLSVSHHTRWRQSRESAKHSQQDLRISKISVCRLRKADRSPFDFSNSIKNETDVI